MIRVGPVRFGSLQIWFVCGTVRAVPVFGCSRERGVSMFLHSLTEGFRLRFPKKGPGSSGSVFGSCKTVPVPVSGSGS